MRRHDRLKGRFGLAEFPRRILLLFLTGFLLGVAFYYFFQNSFVKLTFQESEHSFWYHFFYSIWNHGKYFVLLWLLAASRAGSWYQMGLVIYTGIRQGFLLMFFIFRSGIAGLLIYLASLFPHTLLLLPLYVFSFYCINKNKQYKHRIGMYTAIILVFITACLLEIKCNLPIMEALLSS